MATMPIIDDDMVDLFRRTGRPRSRLARRHGGMGGKSDQVQLQGRVYCSPGEMVRCRDENGIPQSVQCPLRGYIDNCQQ
jgi:hypothetical protein